MHLNENRGHAAELAVGARLIEAGFEVAYPQIPAEVDIVARTPRGCWVGIQVKAGSTPRGRNHPTVDLRQNHRGRRYAGGAIDFFIVWLPENQHLWVFSGQISARSIRLDPTLPGFENLDLLKECSRRVCTHPRP